MASLTLTGARALVQVAGPGQVPSTVGWFDSVSLGLAIDVTGIFTLGRFSAAETVNLAQELVRVSCSGWRVVGSDPYQTTGLPLLQELMISDYISINILDRQTNEVIYKVHEVRAEGYSTTISARQPVQISATFVGILIDSDTSTNAEAAGASVLN